MKASYLLAQILSSTWSVDHSEVLGWLPQINNWLTGVTVIDTEQNKPAAFSILDENSKSINTTNFLDAPKNSIAIINLEGPMILKGDFCSYGTEEIAGMLNSALTNENIIGTILKVNTGGGTTDSIVPLIDSIDKYKAASKPIVSVVSSALSAGAWVASATDKIYAAHNLASFGSIGVFVKFPNMDKYYKEKMGLEVLEIYAPESKDKNLAFREALEGKVKLIQSELLSPIAQEFISKIKEFRGNKLNLSIQGLLSGKTFFAKEAINAGLADDMGKMEDAINYINSLNTSTSITSNNSTNSTTSKLTNMYDKTKIKYLLTALGLEQLTAAEDGSVSISNENANKITKYISDNFGKNIRFKGVSIDDNGAMTLNENSLLNLNYQITDYFANAKSELIAKNKEEYKNKIAKLEEKVAKMSDEPEEHVLPFVQEQIKGQFVAPTSGVNQADDLRPWNKAALAIANGNRKYASFLISTGISGDILETFHNDLKVYGASTIDISQMNEMLGEYHRVIDPNIKDMIVKNAAAEINKLFPMRSTGIKDEFGSVSFYTEEFIQARNRKWSEKGGFSLQAEINKLVNWQVSHRYTANEMWTFIESWLATKTKGTDPFQDTMVQFLTAKMLVHMWEVERPVNTIRGVYIEPKEGIAGKSINSTNGLFKTTQNFIAQNKILVFPVGKGTHQHLVNDEINKEHIYYKINEMIKLIPQNLRDSYNWNIYISKEDERQRNSFIKNVIATDANYKEQELAESYTNFTIKAVPMWVDGLIIITLPGNYEQGYREKNDDNRIYFGREKRDTIVHMDGASITAPNVTGRKYETLEELVASKGLYQRIFTNGEFGPYTPIPVEADATTLSLKVHNVLRTAENTAATIIDGITNYYVGQTFYIIGGSSVNPTTIKTINTKFVGLIDDIVFNEGVIAKFIVTDTDKFTLIEVPKNENVINAISLNADDSTPDISNGSKFVTSSSNTTTTNITNFKNATIGKQFKIIGAGGTETTTIDKAGNFAAITANWTGAVGKEITLLKRSDGKFVEINRL